MKSYEKINYTIRPSKQVERKIFIEAFHRLSKVGYFIQDYSYIGFGSIFYFDFILFHKYLYIKDMLCIERDKIRKRMLFNRPYNFIKVKMKEISELLPQVVNKKKRYLVWLDYEDCLSTNILQDIEGFITNLPEKSIFLITVKAEPEMPKDNMSDIDNGLSEIQKEKELIEYYKESFGRHIGLQLKKSDISRNEIPLLFARVIRSKVEETIINRKGLVFFQLFNFQYNDGTQMLTVGGIIEKETDRNKLIHYIKELPCVKRGVEPLKISVPPLTIREKLYLDQIVHKDNKRISLEIEKNLLKNYFRYYKYYPAYHEIIV